MAGKTNGGVKTLEAGNVYFFYRPRVETEDPEKLGDVQRLFLVLAPDGKRSFRLLPVGQKHLGEPEAKGRDKFWAFVQTVGKKPDDMLEALGKESYETKTRGERRQPAARPAGEGRYRILRHGDHTHFVYALELPEKLREVQKALTLADEASYVISVKNPDKPSPKSAGLPEKHQAEYSKTLQDVFRGRKFGELDPPDFLDVEGTELVLVSAAGDIEEELGVSLDTEDESRRSADMFKELHLEAQEHPVKPLFEGRWE